MTAKSSRKPRILMITPEITSVPDEMGHDAAHYCSAKAGGLADVCAGLVGYIWDQGCDIHLAIPNYRKIFEKRRNGTGAGSEDQPKKSSSRIHFADAPCFADLSCVYTDDGLENTKLSLNLQREVIQKIIPTVRPDLIHCHDWMTGLIPAYARKAEIPTLFTFHNIHTVKSPLAFMEHHGLDPRPFWHHLYFDRMPRDYEESKGNNPVEFMTSAILAADYVNTVGSVFLGEILENRLQRVEKTIREELIRKIGKGCAVGIMNAPDKSWHPERDKSLVRQYTAADHSMGKAENKRAFQTEMGLGIDPKAPLFFWPSRLDPIQKGCDLLAGILTEILDRYESLNLQIAFVANGPSQSIFKELIQNRDLSGRAAVADFDERLSRLGYAAADFILMPSSFEPCGLPQMIGGIYGTPAVAHMTGGLRETVHPLIPGKNQGNGFPFNAYDGSLFLGAIDAAVSFYLLPEETFAAQIRRIMSESMEKYNHEKMAQGYMELYEKMLPMPLV